MCKHCGGGNLEIKIIEYEGDTEIREDGVRKGNGAMETTARRLKSGGVSNTLTSVEKDNYLIETEMEKTERPKGKGWVWDDETRKWFRIRKLTPRECFRLMDVSESDIDKIQNAGISKSQQYKMAGNSIVVACLAGIFGNLFDTTERIKTTLF